MNWEMVKMGEKKRDVTDSQIQSQFQLLLQ